jgi:hypothetical protein
MKKAMTKKRKPIDFSNGVRGKYADMDLVIVGAAPDKRARVSKDASPEAILKKVSRVLDSAGPRKRDLEAAVNRARNLIESARHA